MYDLFLFAGEKSGDLHGSKLLSALYFNNPKLSIFGVGGEEMRKTPFTCFLRMEEFQVMGFVDVFLALPKLIKLFKATLRKILEEKPKMVVLIDYPGFNLRLAKALRKKGYQGTIIQYICPSVWAWGKKRIPLIAASYNRLFSILPFEKTCFKGTNLQVDYLGHPLIATLAQHPYRPLEIPAGKKVVAIFPGSRRQELQKNLPLLLKVARTLHEKYPDLYFCISCAQPHFQDVLQTAISDSGLSNVASLIEPKRSYDLMRISHLALAKSGTVTLELALHQVPTVVVYGISPLDLFIARDLLRIRLPYYSLPNILRKKEVFPEFFGPNFTEENVLSVARLFLEDPFARIQCISECQAIILELGKKDAHQEAAHLIEKNL